MNNFHVLMGIGILISLIIITSLYFGFVGIKPAASFIQQDITSHIIKT